MSWRQPRRSSGGVTPGVMSLAVEDGEDVLQAVPGTGLGILRADKPVSTSVSRLTPEIRRKAMEGHLLPLTQANSRSTVHRLADFA